METMTLLKLEPYSGISGDMFLGAMAPLLDAEAEIVSLPRRLGLENVTVEFTDVLRSSILCRKANVHIGNHAGEKHHHDHGDHHHHESDHHHDHHGEHTHSAHHHDHSHRAYSDILNMIRAADLPADCKQMACDMFSILGTAEAAMHGIPLEQVHFHEVGAEDSIVDLVGAALLIGLLRPSAVYCAPVCVGSGYVKTAHGRLPVPAPATQKILQGFPTYAGPVAREMTTPTGAVILKALQPSFTEPVLVAIRSAMGAGSLDLDQPNALRASLCQSNADGQESITLLQTNLDNVAGELMGADLLGDFLAAGALDAWLSPVLMKKGRPAHTLEILCHPKMADALTRKIITSLPTLGVRRFEGWRTILPREIRTVTTPFGSIQVKAHHLPDAEWRFQPEYASCLDAAKQHNVPLLTVYQSVWSALKH
jgi:pyridinium-3,5-bisthiocarboxylic acid mononucleotide nickel chelatase